MAGDKDFGPNSALYGSFGLLRASQRKLGLTRKADAPAMRLQRFKFVDTMAVPAPQLQPELNGVNGPNGPNGKH